MTTPAQPPAPDSLDDKMKEFLLTVFEEGRLFDRVARMDDLELLWRWYHCPAAALVPDRGADAALFHGILARFCPRAEGDEIEMTDRGWRTPEGEITYEPEFG